MTKYRDRNGASWYFRKSEIISKNLALKGAFEIIDASRESTETIAPFLTIVGIDSTFLLQLKNLKTSTEED